MHKGLLIFTLLLLQFGTASAQESDSTTATRQTDIPDVLRKIFRRPAPAAGNASRSGAILPSLGYNPSMGFIIGANFTAGKYLGPPATTIFSTVLLGAQVTSKGIITAQLRHNVFTNGNRWNLVGNGQLSRLVQLDYGLGTRAGRNNGFSVIGYPLRNTSDVYPVKFTYIRLSERIYRRISRHWYAGGGLSIDVRTNVRDERLAEGEQTPQYRYSEDKGFNWKHNSANGLLFNVQFNNREHPNRSYGGMFADIVVRANQRWLGSSRNALQFNSEIKKYWSLSTRNPETVLAIWHWSSLLLGGSLPYFELPATASDLYNRMGRAYTIGRFRGPSFFYLETELRFPLTRSKLISGVSFLNWQAASNDRNEQLFQHFEAGGGLGLRFLFNKYSRTNLCLDYAVGRYGASGLFLGLNEAF